MKCVIPIEYTKTIRGKGRTIGCIPSLFPSYSPESEHMRQYVSKLNDDLHHVDAIINRRGHHVILGTSDFRTAFNTYLFPTRYSDEFVVSYLKRYSGWQRHALARISYPLQYKNCRLDLAQELYQWEHETFKRKVDPFLPEKNARLIVRHYFEQQRILNYTLRFREFDDKHALATCCPVRDSGLVAPAVEYRLTISKKHVCASTILHEIAHAIDYEKYRALNHGPTFMIIFEKLLKDYFGRGYLPSMVEAGLFKGKQDGRKD